jgi:hypothetical protein
MIALHLLMMEHLLMDSSAAAAAVLRHPQHLLHQQHQLRPQLQFQVKLCGPTLQAALLQHLLPVLLLPSELLILLCLEAT